MARHITNYQLKFSDGSLNSNDHKETIFITFHSGSKEVSCVALRTLYVPQPRLRTGFFSRIQPGEVPPEKYNFAATAGGMKQLAEPMDLDDRTKIDVVVIGSSAVNPETGMRVGKGEGFAELEYGMMRQLGMIDEDTPVITTVHDSQVISENFPPKGKNLMKHDVPVDIIVTPTQTIHVDKSKQPAKPKGIYWDLLSREKLATIRVLQELKARIESQTGTQLELAEQEEALPPLAKRGPGGPGRRQSREKKSKESNKEAAQGLKAKLRRPGWRYASEMKKDLKKHGWWIAIASFCTNIRVYLIDVPHDRQPSWLCVQSQLHNKCSTWTRGITKPRRLHTRIAKVLWVVSAWLACGYGCWRRKDAIWKTAQWRTLILEFKLHESVSTEHHVSAKVVRGAGMCSRSRIESSSVLECLCVEAAIRAIDFNIAGRR